MYNEEIFQVSEFVTLIMLTPMYSSCSKEKDKQILRHSEVCQPFTQTVMLMTIYK